jgi:hypothetical protein
MSKGSAFSFLLFSIGASKAALLLGFSRYNLCLLSRGSQVRVLPRLPKPPLESTEASSGLLGLRSPEPLFPDDSFLLSSFSSAATPEERQ